MSLRTPVALIALAVTVAAASPGSSLAYEPCGIRLDSISAESGYAGDLLRLDGAWGDTQGGKIAVINRGGQNRLEIVTWRSDAIVARIPEGLSPGRYKVGVYCNDLSEGGSYGSGFADFRILAGAASERTPAGGALDDPDPAPRQSFVPAGVSLAELIGWVLLAGAAAAIAWQLLRGGKR